VNSWIEAAKTAKGTDDADHWRAGAARILRGVFLACAHHRIRPGDFRLVREWIAARDLAEPIQILTDLRSFAGDQWADELKGIQNTPEREKGSFFSAAENTIDATADPAVLKSTMRTDLDFERFLGTRSTLYVMSPTEHQRSVSPLISMLVETLAHTAYRMHREGRLPARFAISEDDLANVAPLPGLESMISQGRGQGLTVFWNLQSLAQLAEHYGDRAAEAIWSATRCKIVFGGLADERSVERLSNLIPEEPVVVPGESMTEKGPKGSKHTTYRRLLSAAQLREIPDGWALLLYHNLSPRMLRQPLAVKRFVLSRHIVPWAAVAGRLGAATRAAEAEPAMAEV
jgi:type IV secretory pathway TraG/TraD family ATPase VirD4